VRELRRDHRGETTRSCKDGLVVAAVRPAGRSRKRGGCDAFDFAILDRHTNPNHNFDRATYRALLNARQPNDRSALHLEHVVGGVRERLWVMAASARPRKSRRHRRAAQSDRRVRVVGEQTQNGCGGSQCICHHTSLALGRSTTIDRPSRFIGVRLDPEPTSQCGRQSRAPRRLLRRVQRTRPGARDPRRFARAPQQRARRCHR
jgi:hypothetical protein